MFAQTFDATLNVLLYTYCIVIYNRKIITKYVCIFELHWIVYFYVRQMIDIIIIYSVRSEKLII